MDKETLRMQMLAGVITEGEYKAKLEENKKPKSKKSLKEGMIGGIVGIGAINQIPPRAKTDYETSFEHFLGAKYELNEEMGNEMEKEELIKRIKNLGDFGFTGDKIEVKGLLITASTQEDEGGPYYFVYGEDDDSEDGIFQSTNPNEIAEFVLNYLGNKITEEEVNEGKLDGLYMELKDVLFPYYTDLVGEERVSMIDDVIKELNSYILILQDEKKAKQ